MDKPVTKRALAEALGVPIKNLDYLRERFRHEAPPGSRIGPMIVFEPGDVEKFRALQARLRPHRNRKPMNK